MKSAGADLGLVQSCGFRSNILVELIINNEKNIDIFKVVLEIIKFATFPKLTIKKIPCRTKISSWEHFTITVTQILRKPLF